MSICLGMKYLGGTQLKILSFMTPKVWRGKSEDKKQGSDGVVNMSVRPRGTVANRACLTDVSDDLIDDGCKPPSMARMVLPQSMYTEWFWSGTVGAIAKMCNLRCKDDTQAETRIVADQISDKMKELFLCHGMH